jgi:O-antigen ligase
MAPLVSIAASQILLGAALLAALIARRGRLEMPHGLGIPLALFFAGTVVAVALSADPRAGLPQLRKFYVFLTLPLMYTLVRHRGDVRRIVAGWAVLASASGLWSFVQFWVKRQEAIAQGSDFYRAYLGRRATGFMSHWMTFGAEQMIVLLIVAAAVLFGVMRRRPPFAFAACSIIALSIAISFVRSVWLGTAVGAAYLIAVWRPKLLLLVPLCVPIVWVAAPSSVQRRVISIYRPHGTVDSNLHRDVTRRAGIEMIKTSPVVGIGPEIVGRDFEKYVPADVPRPLPEGFYGHLHNLYLQYGAERGLPTLAAFLWFVTAAVVHLLRRARREPFVHGVIAVMAAILTQAFFELNLGDSEVLSMFLTAVACGYVMTDKESA